MTAILCTLYIINAWTLVKDLVLRFTCPFQIASDRWLGCCVNTDLSMGPGSAYLIRPAFAAGILHKNDKQLARVDIIENKNKNKNNVRKILKKVATDNTS